VTPVTLAGYIGKMIKKRREELNLQQNDVVKKIKEKNSHSTFSASSISRIESGDYNYNLFTLEDLCDALDLHISEVFPIKS
jgi:transcriptional regulator with XRE-family HTH domain